MQFATKTELARAMLGRALDAGVPAAWVTADEAYGKDGKFRGLAGAAPGRLRRRRARRARPSPAAPGQSRADVLAAHAPDQAWKRRSCGNGAKGPRVYDWAAATLPEDGTEPPGWSRYLLVRRSLTRNAKGELELAYYLCAAPAGTSDEDLIRVAGARWAVEVGHRWYRSSCAAFSWLCSLFLVGFVVLPGRCPAGAGVVAGRACPALA